MAKYFVQLEQAACRLQFRDDSPAFIKGWLPQLWQQVEGCPEHGTSQPLPENTLAESLGAAWPYAVVFQKGTLLLALASDKDAAFIQQVMSQWCQALIENQWPAQSDVTSASTSGVVALPRLSLPGEAFAPVESMEPRYEPEESSATSTIAFRPDADLMKQAAEALAEKCAAAPRAAALQTRLENSMVFDLTPNTSGASSINDELPEPNLLEEEELEAEEVMVGQSVSETSLSFELAFAEGELGGVIDSLAPEEVALLEEEAEETEEEAPVIAEHTASRAKAPMVETTESGTAAAKRRPVMLRTAPSTSSKTPSQAEKEELAIEVPVMASKKPVPANALSALGKTKV